MNTALDLIFLGTFAGIGLFLGVAIAWSLYDCAHDAVVRLLRRMADWWEG